MNEWDRLIELMHNHNNPALKWFPNNYEILQAVEYLLANGVIVPPCKVGDSVYLIPTYGGKPYCGVVEDKVQMIGITSRGVHIKARNNHDHNKMYMLGKTIFLTREEAEQELKNYGAQ